MSAPLLDAFKQIFFFRNLDLSQLQQLAGVTSLKSYEGGTSIFHEGETADAFYIVLEGKVQIYKISKEGKEIILHLFGAGEIFAEVPIFSGIPVYPAHSICVKPSRLLRVDGKGFRALVRADPEMGLRMLTVFAKRLHEFSELIEDLSLRSVEARLAKYLLSVSDNLTGQAEILVQKKILASILGTIPETLSRSFKKLATDGLIAVEGSRIRLLNLQALVILADIPEQQLSNEGTLD